MDNNSTLSAEKMVGQGISPKQKKEAFAAQLLRGAVIGVAGMLPGVSGGVLAVAMGVYRPVLEALNGLFKSFRRSFLYLMPLGLGGTAGLFLTGWAVEWLLGQFRIGVMWALMGMVLGGLPSLIQEANQRGFKARYLAALLAGGLLIGGTVFLQHHLTGGQKLPFNGWTSLLCGALMGLGTVIPGLTTSFLMIHLGLYEPLLSAFTGMDIPMLLCAGAGALAVIILLLKAMKRLFDRHYGYAYYGAMGLLLVSVGLIFPGFDAGWGAAADIAVFAVCFVLTWFLCRLPGEEPLAAATPVAETEKVQPRRPAA